MSMEKYLPLGTVVLLKDAKKRLMIIGYEGVAAEELEKFYDYIGCMYPEGMISSDKNFLFNHDQIETIYFNGYSDGEDLEYKQTLKEYVENRNNLETKEENIVENDIKSEIGGSETNIEIPLMANSDTLKENIETLNN